MVIIIVLVIVAVVAYFWYLASPSIQFMRAMSLLHSQRILEAIPVFEDLLGRHPDAPSKLAECKLKQGIEYSSYDPMVAKSFFEQVIDIKKNLPEKVHKKPFERMEVMACLKIAEINFNSIVSEKSVHKRLNLLRENLQYIEDAPQKGAENLFTDLHRKHIAEIAELYYALGIECEKKYNFVEAVQLYGEIRNLIPLDSVVRMNAPARMLICMLKNGEEIDASLLGEIEYASEEIRRDLYFRYAKKLIKGKKYPEAERIILQHLNINSPVIEKLKEYIRADKLAWAVGKINKINLDLDKLYEKSFTIDDLKIFYDSLNIEIEAIKPIVPTVTEKIKQFRPSLFNRLLINYIEEKKFANAINIIQKSSEFLENPGNPELLKDLGICCYGYVSGGNIDENNYKVLISYYLTAVYSDKVMLKSLEQTSSDNHYTYTLVESIGSSHKFSGTLPDNVNCNAVSETNISIGATQKELLAQFQTLLLQKINAPALENRVQSFFSSEKEAIERLIQVIDRDVLAASPFFAQTFDVNDTLPALLYGIYDKTGNENALDAAIPYLKPESNAAVREYAFAKGLVYKIAKAVQTENLNELKALSSEEKTRHIKKFNRLNAKAEDLLFNTLVAKMDKNRENELLIPLMEEIIRFVNQKEKFIAPYSSYVTFYCINKVNAGTIDRFKALSLMKNAYLCSPGDSRICKNFVILIKLNLTDILNDPTKQTTGIYNLLNEVYLKRSLTFKKESIELGRAGNNILQKLRLQGTDLSRFDHNQGSLRREEQNLNAQGRRIKEVVTYLKKMSEV